MKDEFVLLVSESGPSYLVKPSEGSMNTSDGIIDLTQIKRKRYGGTIKSRTGARFKLVKPTTLDVLRKRVKRSAQIMSVKEIGAIIANTGIGPESLIVDAGTGTGYLPIFLGRLLPKSKIVTYESDKDFYDAARKNIQAAGARNVRTKNRDVTKGIQERNVGLVVLDLKDSHKAVDHAHKALVPGGWLVVYSPTADHLISTAKALRKSGFGEPRMVEVLEREWQSTKTVRPKTHGVLYTGFLTFARKT